MSVIMVSVSLLWHAFLVVAAVVMCTILVSGFTVVSVLLLLALLFIGVMINIAMHINIRKKRRIVKKG
jgi:hypothetical protein